MAKLTARNERGRFLPILCDDPNCDGSLMLDTEFGHPTWICDGLTHDTASGPLRACKRSYSALASIPDERNTPQPITGERS